MNFIDQLNRCTPLSVFPPRKIISLVPSQTELLSHFGLNEEVIGITKFCIHPDEWFRSKTRVGGTKKLNLPLIKSLQPDLIVANKEENLQAEIEELAKDFPVWISDVKNLDDACEMILLIGELVGKKQEAKRIETTIKEGFNDFQSSLQPQSSNLNPRTAYLIWKDPYMTVGGDTFISDMIERCGLMNIYKNKSRYPELDLTQLSNSNCEVLLLSSEPYPFKETHVNELQVILPQTKILLVDGEMFSWYGSRLQYAPAYFSELRKLIFNC